VVGYWIAAARGVALAAAVVLGAASGVRADATDDTKAGMAADALRLLEQADQRKAQGAASPAATFLAPTPGPALTEADLTRALQAGAPPLRGIDRRDAPGTPPDLDPYFEGTFKRTHHLYLGRDLVTYDRGVYAVPRTQAYVGTFTYFAQPTMTDVALVYPKGSFVAVGKKLTPDGKAETGIFIAEDVTSGFALHFVKATPAYLADFERRHARAAETYRREQAAAAAESGFDFGQVLALGLGVAMIGGADLPGADKLELGQAFVSDALGDGDGAALMSTLMSSGQGAGGGGSLFAGGTSFQAPGLDGMLAGLMQQAGTAPAAGAPPATPATGAPLATPAAAPAPAGAAKSETYSFSCPSGASYSIPISYRNAACGAAMKNFARAYSCNLIGDFAPAGQQCKQACGNAQCAEQ
jgi:hypothetical protein